MERVAEPAPSLALTTSSPPNWTPVVCQSSILSLEFLVHTVYESIKLLSRNADAGLGLAEERDDGLARVTANDGNVEVGGVLLASYLCDEGLGTDNIECGDTEQLLGVEDTSGLEHLGGNRDCRVDWVGDDEDVGLGAVLGDALDETLDDAGVDLEEVVTGHARLAYGLSVPARSNADSIAEAHVRGMPAGMTTMSAPLRAAARPSSLGR